MRVIIPAAGGGQRFKNAGYVEYKPMINVLSKPMIMHVIEAVQHIDPKPLVACLPQIKHGVLALGAEPVIIKHPQAGAALSVLCANGHLCDTESVMAVDCDNLYDRAQFVEFLHQAQEAASRGEALLLTTEDFTEATNWSFVHGANGRVVYVREKERVSNRIICGANAFPSWHQLRQAICTMVGVGQTVNNEFYLIPAVNYLDCVTRYHDIPSWAFRTVGTPEALKQVEEAEKYAHERLI